MRLYAFDLDVNLFYIPSKIMMERYENGEWTEEEVNAKDFIEKNKREDHRISTQCENPFHHFRDDNVFMRDFAEVYGNWPDTKGPSFDKFRECIINGYKLSIITARGQSPDVIRAALMTFITVTSEQEQEDWGDIYGDVVRNFDIYPVSSKAFNKEFGTDNENYSVPYKKQMAFKDFLNKNYDDEPISIGYSDDDPKNMEHIKEIMEGELIKECPQCHFVLYDTSEGSTDKSPLTNKKERT